MILIVLTLTFVATIVAFFPTPILGSPALKMFRLLFPSWRFFEAITPIPKTHFRTSADGELYSDWEPLLWPPAPRGLLQLVHNPEENLRIALRVQIEQCLNDIAEQNLDDQARIEALTSYQIVHSTLTSHLRVTLPPEAKFFQYKISVLEFPATEFHSNIHTADALLSAPQER